MDIFQVLSIVSCVSSLLTLVMVAIAVLPHAKQGAVIIRDAILWVTFVFVLSFVGWIGWQRVFGNAGTSAVPQLRATATQATAHQSESHREIGDRLYGGPRVDP
jgi:hypothetical protein